MRKSYLPTDTVTYNPIILNKFKQYLSKRISPEQIEMMRFRQEDFYGELAIEIEHSFWGEQVIEEVRCSFEFQIPQSAWEHFKQDYFPAWLLKRFPVKTKNIVKSKFFKLDRVFMFPKAYNDRHPILDIFIITDRVEEIIKEGHPPFH